MTSSRQSTSFMLQLFNTSTQFLVLMAKYQNDKGVLRSDPVLGPILYDLLMDST